MRGGRTAVVVLEPGDWQIAIGAEQWEEIQVPMIDAMIRLEEALKPHIARLKVEA